MNCVLPWTEVVYRLVDFISVMSCRAVWHEICLTSKVNDMYILRYLNQHATEILSKHWSNEEAQLWKALRSIPWELDLSICNFSSNQLSLIICPWISRRVRRRCYLCTALLQTPFACTGKGKEILDPLLSCLEIHVLWQIEISNAAFLTGGNISRCSKNHPTAIIRSMINLAVSLYRASFMT